MKNLNRLHVNNERFSVRFMAVCENYNLKTIGQVRQLTGKMNINALLSIRGRGRQRRVSKIVNELNFFTENYNK